MSPTKQLTIFVTGATGVQGGALARQLLSAGHKVRALVRDPSQPQAQELSSLGVVIIKGGFDNVEALEEAAQSSDAVFINTTPTYPNTTEINQVGKIIAAAKHVGTVKHVIYSSTLLAGKHEQMKAWNEFKTLVSWVWEGKNAN